MKAKTRANIKWAIISASGALFLILASMVLADTQSQWYVSLVKPAIQPPPVVLIAAQTAAHIAFAIAAYFACRRTVIGQRKTQLAYGINAALVLLWTYAFFTVQNLFGALLVAIALFAATSRLIRRSVKVSAAAGWLLVPPLMWEGFVIALNYGTVMLN